MWERPAGKDWNVASYAGEGDFIVVTNNGDDFRKLYATRLLHAGLVILVPNDGRAVQKRLFTGALDYLAHAGELVNRVLEVDLKAKDITFRLYDLPGIDRDGMP
jgi:hypothetical protein